MLKVFVIAKPCKRLRQSVFLFKGITDSFVLRTQNDRPFSHCGAGVRWTPLRSRSTDRAGRQDRRKVRGNPSFRSTSLRSRANGCGNPFFYLRVFTDSFVLRTQNDRPFSLCGAGVRWTPLRSRSTDRAGRRDRRKVLFFYILRCVERR